MGSRVRSDLCWPLLFFRRRRRQMPAWRSRGPFGHDAIAIARGRSEHAVVGDELLVRPWNERAEAFEERQRIEDDVRRAIGMQLELRLM